MPSGSGNCRFPQYSGFLNNLIIRKKLKNTALLSLTPENSFAGIPIEGMLSTLKGIVISDVMEDIKNSLKVLAVDKDAAMKIIDEEWLKIRAEMRTRGAKHIYSILKKTAKRLKSIKLRYKLSNAKKVSLMGDIFARRDDFSCQDIIETLSNKDIVVKRDHVYGFLNYFDYMVQEKVYDSEFSLRGWIEFYGKRILQNIYEYRIKSILASSGLYEKELVNMKDVFKYAKQFFSIQFTGEQGVLVGNFYRDILHSMHGAISLGPFACMPVKVAEAILEKEATLAVKEKLENKKLNKKYGDITNLPFLAIETDGNPYPQIVQAKIESFCLQVDRVFEQIEKNK
jgi:predicted nucleotide-binding protein (sugar kinase/HSP70/actin superfamily)